jgi:phosphoglycerol transferase MdoB-like AlkP superfamily enzyme
MVRFNQVARQSVRFKRTYTVLPYTTKAFWAALTGTTPTVQEDYVEAIPMNPPYEGMASILRRAGYRSAFFEMSKGSFECAPGLFANLAFDWAWFRENLEDKSAYLGYMGGDDCRIIAPAFKWVTEGNEPFFLAMITSVSHDPYDVPRWFDKPAKTPYEKYLQTIRFNDYFLGQICDKLEELKLGDSTILCVLGDHGTSFRVQQGRGRWIPYEEVICVPWIIRWPGHIEPGKCIDQPCSQMDVTPTLLRLIGFDIAQAGFEGKDALGNLPPKRRFYFSSWYPDSPAGFLEGSRKVVYWPYLDKVFEFDLAADPDEKRPRTLESQRAERIKQEILAWQKKSQIVIDAKRHTEDFLFDHWQTFSAGRSAWAYYIP